MRHCSMPKVQDADNIKHRGGHRTAVTLTHCWWQCGMALPLGKTVGQFLTKLNIVLPYGSVMTILGTYPKELEAMFTQKSACGCLQ